MKKEIWFLFFVLVPIKFFAQESFVSVQDSSDWLLGFSGGPNYTFRRINFFKEKEDYSSQFNAKLYRDSVEVPDINYSFSFQLERKIGKKFRVRTGLNLNRISYSSLDVTGIYIGSDPLTGIIYGSGKYEYRYTIFSVPLEGLFSVPFRTKNFKMYFGAGLFPGIKHRAFFVNDKHPPTFPYNAHPISTKLNLDYDAFVGFSYEFDDKSIFFTELNYQRSSFHLPSKSVMATHLFSVGLNFGIRVGFSSRFNKYDRAQDSVKINNRNKYSIYVGGAVNYLFTTSYTSYYDNGKIINSPMTYRFGADLFFSYEINKHSSFWIGFSYNEFNTKSRGETPNTFGDYKTRSSTFEYIGMPVFYCVDFGKKRYVYPSMYIGLLFNKLNYNRTEVFHDDGTIVYSQQWYVNGSLTLSAISGVKMNILMGDKFVFSLGLEYGLQLTSFETKNGAQGKYGAGIDYVRLISGIKYQF